MTSDIANYLKNSEKGILNKTKPHTKQPMQITETPCTKGFRQSGARHNQTTAKINSWQYLCRYTCVTIKKYLVTIPTPDKEAKTIARALHFILIFGTFKTVKTDMGNEYQNAIMNELCKVLKMEQRFSTAYHHETLGSIERNHRTFNQFIRTYASENIEYWDDYLKYFTFCYNKTSHESLGNKFASFELVFAKNANLPQDLLCGNVDPLYDVGNFVLEAKYRLQTANKIAKYLLEKMKLKIKKLFDTKINPTSRR